MNNLLHANFVRLFKNKVFWLCMVLMAGWGAYAPLSHLIFSPELALGPETLKENFFVFVVGIGLFLAAFCSLFLGTEYSDGAIRNKLVVGHTRSAIYLTNFIVCAVAGLLMCCAYLAAVSAAGIPVYGGFFKEDTGAVLRTLLACMLVAVAYASIMTFVSMLNQNKAAAAVISIIGVLVLVFIAMNINRVLFASEFQTIMIKIEGGFTTETVRNPDYVTGTVRSIYQFIFDFLPTGQAMQLSNITVYDLPAAHAWRMPLYSLVIVILTNTAGVFTFRKKNLK